MARKREAMRRVYEPNPYREDHTPYPDQKRGINGVGEGTGGSNEYRQQNQVGKPNGTVPWPEGAPSDSDSWSRRRSAIRKNMNKPGSSY